MARGFDNMHLVFTYQPCEDNERNSYNANQYISSPIYKEVAQHSTVIFTNILNVSYTMSSPIKRLRNKAQGDVAALPSSSERSNTDIGDLCESNRNKVQINNQKDVVDQERQNNPEIPTMFKRDCIHWSKNCVAFLSFHR
jgi:hypothetical protein